MPQTTMFYDPAAAFLGGFSSLDGTVEFYGRVHALLEPDYKVLDLGAGRGAWYFEDQVNHRRNLRNIRSKVIEYIGADVDEAVLQNPTTTSNLIIRNSIIPIDSNTVDLIICDYVLEHLTEFGAFKKEVSRVLKPGGYFCGRTPHRLHYVSLAASLIESANHARWLRGLQPNRKHQDIFPTMYQCNTLKRLAALFAGWENYSYLYSSDPQYYFGNKMFYRIVFCLHKFAPSVLTANIFIFIRKPMM
jgi:ubiquinone/menaquinone biosynthesis C-methylase UbiE